MAHHQSRRSTHHSPRLLPAQQAQIRPAFAYRTKKSFITAQHRNWQVGLYALAAPNLNLGPVRRLTLDMLRHEKPLEFDLGDDNIAREINSPKTFFNLHTVKQELMQTAQQILACYDTNFKPCHIEKNCSFCNE